MGVIYHQPYFNLNGGFDIVNSTSFVLPTLGEI